MAEGSEQALRTFWSLERFQQVWLNRKGFHRMAKHQGGPGTDSAELLQEKTYHLLVLTLQKCAETLLSAERVTKKII